MKSFNHLFEECIKPQNIDLAIYNVRRGSRIYRRRKMEKYMKDIDKFKADILNYFCHYENAPHVPKVIHDGVSRKKRTIIVPTIMELIVQHMLMNVFQMHFRPSFYFHSYGSIPNKGSHLGKEYIRKFVQNAGEGAKYFLKMDIRKFFDSVPHNILKAKLSKRIRDKKYLEILFKIIDVTEVGIPIGFYTSQWLANWYLTDFDHWVKEELKIKAYYRYMDDMVIFGSNKKKLHKIRLEIEHYLNRELGLTLKENWTVARFDYKDKYRFLDFMGFKFYRNKITIRKSILKRSRRKAYRIAKKDKASIHDCRSMLAFTSYFAHTNCKRYYNRYIKPKVCIPRMKKYISKYTKTQNSI